MGIVYLARELAGGRPVAIKLLGTPRAGDTDAARRFAREARTVAALDHPHIVRTLAIEELSGDAIAIVSEYIPGQTLRARLRETGPLPFEHAALVLRDIASALAHAHRFRIVHRDVKPENIFVEQESGRALLADFGIARPLDADSALTVAGASLGTPTYMAPEQVRGDELDERADVYSLGLVGWEMLAGSRPWEGETLYDVLHKQQHHRLPSLAELRPDIPMYLLVAIEGALSKHPDERWADGAELLTRLTPTPATLPPRRSRRDSSWADEATVPIAVPVLQPAPVRDAPPPLEIPIVRTGAEAPLTERSSPPPAPIAPDVSLPATAPVAQDVSHPATAPVVVDVSPLAPVAAHSPDVVMNEAPRDAGATVAPTSPGGPPDADDDREAGSRVPVEGTFPSWIDRWQAARSTHGPDATAAAATASLATPPPSAPTEIPIQRKAEPVAAEPPAVATTPSATVPLDIPIQRKVHEAAAADMPPVAAAPLDIPMRRRPANDELGDVAPVEASPTRSPAGVYRDERLPLPTTLARRRATTVRGLLVALVLGIFITLMFLSGTWDRLRGAGSPLSDSLPTTTSASADSTPRGEVAVRDSVGQGRSTAPAVDSASRPTVEAPPVAVAPPVAPPAAPERRPPASSTPPAASARARPPVPAPAAPRVRTPASAAPAAPVDADAGGDRCSTPTAAAQRACLLAGIDRNDADLNRSYQALIARLRREAGGVREPPAVQALRVEQRAWVADRDRVCRSSAGAGSGPLWGAESIPCFARMSEEREAELRTRLQERTARDSARV
jgi:serine/threonine protein kinase/uncharacterized protein YecT (DUF1311 family)